MTASVLLAAVDLGAKTQATTSDIGTWALVLLFAATLIDRIYSIQQKRKNDPQRREISFSEEYASKTEFKAIERRVKDVETKLERELAEIRREMKEDRETILQAGEERAVKIHERINAVLSGVSRLEGRLDK